MIYIAITPGFRGAIAVITPGGIKFHNLPILVEQKQIDYIELAALLRQYTNQGKPCIAAIELMGVMPSHGSIEEFGLRFWVVNAVLAFLQISYESVIPNEWKAFYQLNDRDQNASRTKAIELFPHCASELGKKKDYRKAEALLLAQYLTNFSSSRSHAS